MQFDQLRRRDFVIGLAAAALLPCSQVLGQDSSRVYRLGVLSGIARDSPQVAAVYDELRRAGFLEGHNLVVAAGGYGLRADDFAHHASIIATSDVDVIY